MRRIQFSNLSASSKTKKYLLLLTGIILLVIVFMSLTRPSKDSGTTKTTIQNGETVGVAKKSALLNKEFIFPINDDKGIEVSKLKYSVESAELRDEIIVKGQKATSLPGRTFLIVNIKIANDLDKIIKINTKDYVRLMRNGNTNEQLAPDIHNDPVEVQAISTKYTRVGFPINNSDTDLQLQVGEIKGYKETVSLAFN